MICGGVRQKAMEHPTRGLNNTQPEHCAMIDGLDISFQVRIISCTTRVFIGEGRALPQRATQVTESPFHDSSFV